MHRRQLKKILKFIGVLIFYSIVVFALTFTVYMMINNEYFSEKVMVQVEGASTTGKLFYPAKAGGKAMPAVILLTKTNDTHVFYKVLPKLISERRVVVFVADYHEIESMPNGTYLINDLLNVTTGFMGGLEMVDKSRIFIAGHGKSATYALDYSDSRINDRVLVGPEGIGSRIMDTGLVMDEEPAYYGLSENGKHNFLFLGKLYVYYGGLRIRSFSVKQADSAAQRISTFVGGR